jgi:hypothetical protein
MDGYLLPRHIVRHSLPAALRLQSFQIIPSGRYGMEQLSGYRFRGKHEWHDTKWQRILQAMDRFFCDGSSSVL